MRKSHKKALGTLVTISATVLTSGVAAHASEPVNPRILNGCNVTYSMTSSYMEQYGADTKAGLERVTALSGISFNETAGPADINYAIGALPAPMLGKADPNGNITLVSKAISQKRFTATRNLAGKKYHAQLLPIHETLHYLGLGHSSRPGEVMSPTISPNATFSAGDVAGLTAVAAANGCQPSTAVDPADAVINGPATVQMFNVIDSTVKSARECSVVNGAWDVSKSRCTRQFASAGFISDGLGDIPIFAIR